MIFGGQISLLYGSETHSLDYKQLAYFDLSRCRGKNVHGFFVLQQNFNRGDITFLTKNLGDVVKKRLQNQDLKAHTHTCLTALCPRLPG